jgi:DNA-binding NarL/FixJ family response regulator
MNKTTKIGLLLVDDHAIVREGYRALLTKQPDLQLLAEAADGMQAYQLFKEYAPDVVITDLSLPGMSGLEVIARIKQRCTQARILVFSMHQNPTFASQAFAAGALGYVTKNSQPEVLLQGIREVYAQRLFLSDDMAQSLAVEKITNSRLILESLTGREFEILQLLLKPHSPDEIAKILSISPKTVCNCHYLIKRKLGVNSDIELTQLAIKLGVLER